MDSKYRPLENNESSIEIKVYDSIGRISLTRKGSLRTNAEGKGCTKSEIRGIAFEGEILLCHRLDKNIHGWAEWRKNEDRSTWTVWLQDLTYATE